jgi:ATP-binding cassette subfamily F protein uup
MALITLMSAQLAFGHVPLLDRADFSLDERERVGLIGRNGTGKSSLLKILAGMERADDGTLSVQQGLRIAYVAQEPAIDSQLSVFDALAQGLSQVRGWIDQYLEGASSHRDGRWLGLGAAGAGVAAATAARWARFDRLTLGRHTQARRPGPSADRPP